MPQNNLHVTFTLDHATAELLVAGDSVPMRLAWHEFPEAFARYMGHLSNGNVQVDALRRTTRHALELARMPDSIVAEEFRRPESQRRYDYNLLLEEAKRRGIKILTPVAAETAGY